MRSTSVDEPPQPQAVEPVTAYVRREAVMAAIVNVVVNPLLAWLGHRDTDELPLGGSNGITVDLAVTAVVLALVVSLYARWRVRRDRDRLRTMGAFPPCPRWLSHLPATGVSLGLLLGLGIAVVAVIAGVVLDALGVSSVSLAPYIVFKAAYGGLLGFVVMRWTMLRQLSAISPAG